MVKWKKYLAAAMILFLLAGHTTPFSRQAEAADNILTGELTGEESTPAGEEYDIQDYDTQDNAIQDSAGDQDLDPQDSVGDQDYDLQDSAVDQDYDPQDSAGDQDLDPQNSAVDQNFEDIFQKENNEEDGQEPSFYEETFEEDDAQGYDAESLAGTSAL